MNEIHIFSFQESTSTWYFQVLSIQISDEKTISEIEDTLKQFILTPSSFFLRIYFHFRN